jgi:sulfide:quinone oxidoreductase
MFQWIYWHSLLPGRNIPGITSQMPLAGKHGLSSPEKEEVLQ